MSDKSIDQLLLSDSVGSRLKLVRERARLSQRELARRSGVTNGTLSNIEQGKVSPSIQSLEKILNVIPVTLQEFFSDNLETSPSVYRSSDFIEIHKDDTDYRILPLNEFPWVSAYIAHQSYAPGAKVTSDWMVSKGLVAGILISGNITLTLDGVTHELQPGDGFSFSVSRPHLLDNTGDAPCIIVAVSFSD
jgi:transcriptional regulator with XRE-family HTH domain